MSNPITKADIPKYEHNRNIVISDGDDFGGEPFIITVSYYGTSNTFKGIELDNSIMPKIRSVLEPYIEKRPRADVKTRRLKITATHIIVRSQRDAKAAGTYLIDVDADLTDQQAASCALDVFHNYVGITDLEDFEFGVFDHETGKELEEDPNHDSYSLMDRGRFRGRA